MTGAGGAALAEGAGAPAAAAASEDARSSASFRALLPSNTWTCKRWTDNLCTANALQWPAVYWWVNAGLMGKHSQDTAFTEQAPSLTVICRPTAGHRASWCCCQSLQEGQAWQRSRSYLDSCRGGPLCSWLRASAGQARPSPLPGPSWHDQMSYVYAKMRQQYLFGWLLRGGSLHSNWRCVQICKV